VFYLLTYDDLKKIRTHLYILQLYYQDKLKNSLFADEIDIYQEELDEIKYLMNKTLREMIKNEN